MAKLIGYGISGVTHDFELLNAANAVWNGAAFVAWSDADYASYRVTATEHGTTGEFIGTEVSDAVRYRLRQRGASLAASPVVWTDRIFTDANVELVKGEDFDPVDELSGATLTISPYVATVTNPRRASRDLAPISQGSSPTDRFVILDADGAAIDLTAVTVRFVVAEVTDANDADDKTDDELEALYQYESGTDTNITIGGTGNNEISVTHSATRTATCGKFRYWLWRMDVPVDVSAGSFEVRPAKRSV